jgi:hypothetical protein
MMPSEGSSITFQMTLTMIPDTISGTRSRVLTTPWPNRSRVITIASPRPSRNSTETAPTVKTIVFQSAVRKRSLPARST